MKKFLLFSIIIIGIIAGSTSCNKDDDNSNEPEESKPYQGSLINPTFEELQTFYEEGYDVINGSVEFDNVQNLANMLTLSNVKYIKSNFKILNNNELLSLEGLSKLDSIGGDFNIDNNDKLANLDGLSNLSAVDGKFTITNNDALLNFCGIKPLLTANGVAEISIYDNYYNPSPDDIIAGNCGE